MQIDVHRTKYDTCTIGEMIVNGVFQCYTLEDVVRPDGAPKVYGKTAIPHGSYDVIINHSPHFGRDLPLLLDVPGFEGIRIHPGNTAGDTDGCILVGMQRLPNAIGQSVIAFNGLFSKLQGCVAIGEPIKITLS